MFSGSCSVLCWYSTVRVRSCVVFHTVLFPLLLHGGTGRKGKGREHIATWLYSVQSAGKGRLAQRRMGKGHERITSWLHGVLPWLHGACPVQT